ncbi:MAG: hypothetical protein KBD83_07685 [Gammaproteobacteria bacterium]|nr:hypothetical protein [Gammaproteobacteria bacterium]
MESEEPEQLSDDALAQIAYLQAFNSGNAGVKMAFFYRKDKAEDITDNIVTQHLEYLMDEFSDKMVNVFKGCDKKEKKGSMKNRVGSRILAFHTKNRSY